MEDPSAAFFGFESQQCFPREWNFALNSKFGFEFYIPWDFREFWNTKISGSMEPLSLVRTISG